MFKLKYITYQIYLIIAFFIKKQKRYVYGKEKSFFKKLSDHISWLFRDNQFNSNYYVFGLNIINTKQAEFIGRKEFLEIKNEIEKLLALNSGVEHISYEVITKDKFLTFAYFNALSIPVVPVKGFICNNVIYFNNKITVLDELFNSKGPFIVKDTILESGDGFLYCEPIDEKYIRVNDEELSKEKFKDKIKNRRWIIQEVIRSHEKIRLVNSTSLNTTRIVTILNGEKPVFLTGFQAFATGQTKIDSWGKGAVYVGFDPFSGKLKDKGYFHPSFSNKSVIYSHPDSGIVFRDYQLPFISDAIILCIKAHGLLFTNFVIGWDVVITDNGPLILEGNEKPGMNAVQCINGGLRSVIKQYYINTINYLRNRQ